MLRWWYLNPSRNKSWRRHPQDAKEWFTETEHLGRYKIYMKFNASEFELRRYGKEQEMMTASTYISYDDSNVYSKEQVRGLCMPNLSCIDLKSTAWLSFTCQYLCGTILVTPYSMVWRLTASRAGPSCCSLPFCLLMFSLSINSLYGQVFFFWGRRTDMVLIAISQLALPTFLNNNTNHDDEQHNHFHPSFRNIVYKPETRWDGCWECSSRGSAIIPTLLKFIVPTIL